MANLAVKTGKGFSKADALTQSGFATEVKYDSTVAYKKAVKELGKKFDLATFAQDQIDSRAKGLVGAGFSITVEPGKEDSRERPYKEDVVITTKARKYTGTYALVTGADGLVGGTIVGLADDKTSARKQAKDYISEVKTGKVVIVPIKQVTDGENVAAVITYTPSKGATEGEYIFFGLEA